MVYNRVGVVDLTPFAKLEVKGPDACDFMDRICANAVPKVNEGLCYTDRHRSRFQLI